MAKALRIKTDDTVVVISGKDKGKTGKVLSVDPTKAKVVVEGVNVVKRHKAPQPGNPNAPVGVIESEGAIHISNVALADPKDNKPTRVGVVRRDDGRRVRVAKRSGTEID